MSYDPQNAKESDVQQLPEDSVLDGVITEVQDGVVRDFVKNTESWKGDITSPCIKCVIEVEIGEEIKEMVKFEQVFTYKQENGFTTYSKKSNLAKFKQKYGKLPSKGVAIKVITNSEGFGKVKLE